MNSPPKDAASNSIRATAHWFHWTTVIIVFSINGVLSLLFSRFLLTGVLHIEGGVWSGPWSYRLAYLLFVPPFYSVGLVLVGTFFGKHAYFKRRVLATWGRILPKAWRSSIR